MSLRILLVDDEQAVLRSYTRALSEIPGAQIVEQRCSRLAAEQLASQSFDLLVSDIRMPLVDGVELLKLAHQHHPDLPVILITGAMTAEAAAKCAQYGAAATLMKPILPDVLLATVFRVLGFKPPPPRAAFSPNTL